MYDKTGSRSDSKKTNFVKIYKGSEFVERYYSSLLAWAPQRKIKYKKKRRMLVI